ncbi:hypothetical protein KVR01_001612 [Diaporthe batatas]|uniref:uncharacterized protein n=1 Tax=Diaporthe batatas TaxID=748121 RepID=UPI001D047D24|nr:uncharacterized protein KVR01_001612 [Diaporthe batatas]KAG8168863.1 hypothetical protein KVR01_001612 [Diaporthe batatas]
MASGWFGKKAVELISARSLFINVSPAPTSLSERRAVLHALRRHGQIEVFKRLPSPETFVCAPARTEVATGLVQRSPLTFKFVSETFESLEEEIKPGTRAIGVASPIKVQEEGAKGTGAGNDVAKAAQPQRSDLVRTFTMQIKPSQSYYEHKKNIRLSPTHGPWPKADSPQTRREDRDFVYLALTNAVPDTIARPGLCDWYTGGQLSGEPVSLRAQAADARLWHIRERQQRRKNKDMGKGMQAQMGGDLTSITSLDALCGSANRAQQQAQPADVQNGSDADPTPRTGPPAPPPKSLASPLKSPAWIRRQQFKSNPLADRTHGDRIKKEGIIGGPVHWRSVLGEGKT